VVEGKAYVGGKTLSNTGSHIVDFLLGHQLTKNVALLELKTPKAHLLRQFEYRGGVHAPSSELVAAVAQVTSQRDSLLRSPHLIDSHPEKLAAINPHCIVVIGRTAELDNEPKLRSFGLYRTHLAGVTVITFDELFERVRGLLAVVEGQDLGDN
jgi:Domain of unknown function (DUF4263)